MRFEKINLTGDLKVKLLDKSKEIETILETLAQKANFRHSNQFTVLNFLYREKVISENIYKNVDYAFNIMKGIESGRFVFLYEDQMEALIFALKKSEKDLKEVNRNMRFNKPADPQKSIDEFFNKKNINSEKTFKNSKNFLESKSDFDDEKFIKSFLERLSK